MLHILTQSPFQFNILLFFNMLKKSDDILLIQDGIILAIKDNIYLDRIVQYSINLYVLKEDVCARGLFDKLSNIFTIIEYQGFVQLTEKNKIQIKW